MNMESYIPELKSMGKNFLLYAILSPIFAFSSMYLVNFVKKSWTSGSKIRQWFSLTVIIFILYVILLGF